MFCPAGTGWSAEWGHEPPASDAGGGGSWEGCLVKSFACGDVVPGCDARFVCASDDDVLVQVARHAADVHEMHEVPAAVADSVRARIVTLV